MDPGRLRHLLERVSAGSASVDQALDELRGLPAADLGFARVDLDRQRRQGIPEVVFGEGKTPEQVLAIVTRLAEAGQTAMVTRVPAETARRIGERFERATHHEQARIVVVPQETDPRPPRAGVLVLSGGTVDIPVAEEAAVTAETLGNRVERRYDVGVAGLQRLLDCRPELERARVVVAVAGMEGALPSVVAGLVACPVIGVPVSSGYGTGQRGQAALLAMLNSCAAGLTVVNIDNGFGAGVAAAIINRAEKPGR